MSWRFAVSVVWAAASTATADPVMFEPSGDAPFQLVLSTDVPREAGAQTGLRMSIFRNQVVRPVIDWYIFCGLGVSVCRAFHVEPDLTRGAPAVYQPIPVNKDGRVSWNIGKIETIFFNGLYAQIYYDLLWCQLPGEITTCDSDMLYIDGVDAWRRVK